MSTFKIKGMKNIVTKLIENSEQTQSKHTLKSMSITNGTLHKH